MTAAAALTVAPFAQADPAPVTGVELNQPAAQVIAVEAKYNLTSDQEVGMRELRKLRGEMWDKNVPYDGSTLRQVAAKAGLTTRDAYVNAVQFDHGLAVIALQRAVEETRNFNHERPYNSTCYGNCGAESSATIGGKGAFGQNLHSTGSMASAMHGWGVKEERALRATNGEWSADTRTMNGHLHNFLNPKVTYVGFAGAVTAEGEASAASLATAPTGVTSFTAQQQGAQKQVLHRPAAAGETPSTTPKKLSVTQRTPDITGSVDPEIARILNIVISVISILGLIAGLAQQFGLI